VKGHVTLKTGVMMINSGINDTLLDIDTLHTHVLYVPQLCDVVFSAHSAQPGFS